jgi:hypothetical protein
MLKENISLHEGFDFLGMDNFSSMKKVLIGFLPYLLGNVTFKITLIIIFVSVLSSF